MLTKNDWIKTNFDERLRNKDLPFNVTLNPYDFFDLDFHKASENLCLELSDLYPKLAVAFSGGMDSEYIVRKFHSLKIPILPIIVSCRNPSEERHALNVCKELKIVPKVIQLSEYDFLRYYKKYLYDTLAVPGYNSTQVVVAKEFCEREKYTLISGGHLIGEDKEAISEKNFAGLTDIDHYTDYFFTSVDTIHFYLYNIEIVYSMLPKKYEKGTTWQEYKSQLYGVAYRDKIKAKYSQQTSDILNLMLNNLSSRNYETYSWSKSEILQIFNKYKKYKK